MILNSVTQAISKLPSFVKFSDDQVKELNGQSYSIESVIKEDKTYKFNMVVMGSASQIIGKFQIESYLNKNATKVMIKGIA